MITRVAVQAGSYHRVANGIKAIRAGSRARKMPGWEGQSDGLGEMKFHVRLQRDQISVRRILPQQK